MAASASQSVWPTPPPQGLPRDVDGSRMLTIAVFERKLGEVGEFCEKWGVHPVIVVRGSTRKVIDSNGCSTREAIEYVHRVHRRHPEQSLFSVDVDLKPPG